jgi:integrase
MPRPKSIVPAYRLHKATGQAVVYLDRREHYLGPYGSPESRKAYAAILDRLTDGSPPPESGCSAFVRSPTDKPPAPITVAELFLRFVTEEIPRYSDAEQHCFQIAIRIVRRMFGETPVADFGPLRLRAARKLMIAGESSTDLPANPDGSPAKARKPWSRSFTNKQVKRLRLIFRWGVSWQLVPQAVCDALKAVPALAAGESDALERPPRRAVPEADIEAVRVVLNERHRDIVDLLLLTGARPGEILDLTAGAIDKSGDVWRADLSQHKTRHMGKSRTLFFNATAQFILQKYLGADPAARLFPLRRDVFGHAVKAACLKAGVTPWVPHALRHTVATRLADDVGTEAAQRLLGHATRAMTEHYSRSAERVAVEAAKRLG